MATLCIRPTDCLAGRATFGAHRGVRALAPRSPMQQQRQHESRQTLATASPRPGAMNLRPARGRANGQQRRRRSPPAAGAGAGSPPHKRVMENVVILRRGQVLMNEATAPVKATASAAVPSVARAVAEMDADAGVAAAVRCREPEKEVDESVADVKQRNVEAEKCEIAAAVDQGGAQEEAAEIAVTADNIGTDTKEEEAVVATNQSGAETTEEDGPEAAAVQAETAEPAAAVYQRGPATHEKKPEARGADAMESEPAPAAHRTRPLAEEEAEQAYSGASFLGVAPDPRALPIPVRLLKVRGKAARIRAHVHAPDNDRAPAATAAAA